MTTATNDITLHSILQSWIEARTVRNPRQNEAFRRFLDWTIFMGLPVPPAAEDVAGYLLELLADGASLPMIKRAAKAIQGAYVERRCYLDPRPIEAALAIAATQLSPNRVLN